MGFPRATLLCLSWSVVACSFDSKGIASAGNSGDLGDSSSSNTATADYDFHRCIWP